MNELIKVNYDNPDRPTVSGRELHEALGIKTPYTQWFERMCAYGFVEGKDYILVSQKCETNNPKNPITTITDHEISLDMAKEICMIQRSEIGTAKAAALAAFLAELAAKADPEKVRQYAEKKREEKTA